MEMIRLNNRDTLSNENTLNNKNKSFESILKDILIINFDEKQKIFSEETILKNYHVIQIESIFTYLLILHIDIFIYFGIIFQIIL